MAEYMNKDRFLASMGLKGDEVKYGNHDAEHQHRSYSTYMSYEIMDSVEDSIEEDVAPVVRCKDCRFDIPRNDGTFGCYRNFMDYHEPDDFCSYGERKENNVQETEREIH